MSRVGPIVVLVGSRAEATGLACLAGGLPLFCLTGEPDVVAAISVLVDGRSAVVVVPDGVTGARVVDAVARVASVDDWRTDPVTELAALPIELLGRLSDGASVAEAARASGVSLRTAHRRLAEAVAVLGVSGTTAAATLVRARRDRLIELSR